MKLNTIGFIGLGLIGGSIARRIKQVHPDTVIMAYMRTRSTLEEAKADGIVDIILDGVDETLRACDMIILCTPVSFNESYLKAIRPFIKPGCIVTDVGSTKTAIHETVIALDMEDCFVGGHPMAGSERTGYACSKASLLENAYYVITPTSKTTNDQLDTMIQFAADQAAIPLVLDYKNHDYAVAAISHVPHVIASSLVNLVAKSDFPDGTMKKIAAGGFKDITRIASSSPVMWEQILFTNKDNIISLLEDYKKAIDQTITDLKTDNHKDIYDIFEQSGTYRNLNMQSFAIFLTSQVLSLSLPLCLPLKMSALKISELTITVNIWLVQSKLSSMIRLPAKEQQNALSTTITRFIRKNKYIPKEFL